MRAEALITSSDQQFALRPIDLPDPGPQHVLIRTLVSGVSVGTEFALITGKLSWGPYPLCTGYQAVGVLEAVGAEVSGFEVGQLVYYRDSKLMSIPGETLTPVAGTHSSHAVVDPLQTHGLARLPEGVDLAAASLYVMPAVGLNGVDMANPRMGQSVVCYGAGLIGLGVIAAAAHRGCQVIAIDLDDARLAVARELGADIVINSAPADVEAAVNEHLPAGADVVFESTGIPALIDPAISLCRPRGTFVLQGNYGAEAISYHFLPAHGRRLTVYYPCDDGLAPCRRAVLKNMAMGALKWDKVITHRVTAAESPALYQRILQGQAKDLIGAVIRWSEV
ncbi:MAG: zinc-binding alcohol dehydrogenase [Fimbriimonadaceae bacterium]|nr:zinc-binding alcohol dehydrogenase [Fimbriimonadaceae bacterium]